MNINAALILENCIVKTISIYFDMFGTHSADLAKPTFIQMFQMFSEGLKITVKSVKKWLEKTTHRVDSQVR